MEMYAYLTGGHIQHGHIHNTTTSMFTFSMCYCYNLYLNITYIRNAFHRNINL